MTLTPEQIAILRQITAIPGAIELIQGSVLSYLLEQFEGDIANDPTIAETDAETIREILGRGAGYINELVVLTKQIAEAQP